MLRFIDLFAGLGGIRMGLELACRNRGIRAQCVFSSEIKPAAREALRHNHPHEEVWGDITQIDAEAIPDFDVLLAGFPCQAFSVAGKRLGFEDTRGTLFFEVERILRAKRPQGFILENVEGLVTHDREKRSDKMGRTLRIILEHLASAGYRVAWRVLNAKDFGVPQDRRRIYLAGTRSGAPSLQAFPARTRSVGEILSKGLPVHDSPFVRALLAHYSVDSLAGKSIKDKRGGEQNIHSWDLELKGGITAEQKALMNQMLKERRKKKWAAEYGIDWMDGMPLTEAQIRTFFPKADLAAMLDDLAGKGYLKREYPKRLVGGRREQDETLPLGYNIVAGRLSYEVSKVLDPAGIAPTLVATDMQRIFVPEGKGVRRLSLREGLRLFGYPEDFWLDLSEKEGYDLLGNTVVVPVIAAVAERLLDAMEGVDGRADNERAAL